jgi:adenylylsulfate kinase
LAGSIAEHIGRISSGHRGETTAERDAIAANRGLAGHGHTQRAHMPSADCLAGATTGLYTRPLGCRKGRNEARRRIVTEIKATNITWHEGHVGRDEREKLSGCGKSTIAYTVEHELVKRGHLCYVLDGDNIRHGLNKNLGFSAEDREENIRRIGEVGRLFVDAGIITMTAFISPYIKDRDRNRGLLKDGEFIEVFVDVPIDICEERDPKGLYKKARAGEIKGFTGIDDPYEAPKKPEIVIKNGECTPQEAAAEVIAELERRGLLRPA